MNSALAWRIVQTAFRCGRELQGLLKEMKEGCTETDYEDYARAIATVIDTTNHQLTERAISMYPEFSARIESDLKKYGRIQ
jgi:hypothetical protein